MRKKIVAGNWKMNKSFTEAKLLVEEILASDYDNQVELILFPPALYISMAVDATADNKINVGVQNASQHEKGAFTGEISATMIHSIGAKYSLVGHSERRQYFNETNHDLALKVNQLLANNITPIYCCGEMLPEREGGTHFDVVKQQIEQGLFHLSLDQMKNCIIAYEPVWAIGTGVTATADQAQEMHAFIRTLLADKFGQNVAEEITILYGGSCNPSNAKELFSNQDVDGGLIGGASLVAENFIAIANSF